MFPLAAFDPPPSLFTFYMKKISPVYWTFDLPSQFFMGYHGDGYVELRPAKTAQRYFRTWFFLDLFIILLDWSFIFANVSTGISGIIRMGKVFRIIRVVRVLRLLRISRFFESMQNAGD